MTPASSLPPLKKNDGKYGLIALLFLLAAGGLWFLLGNEDPPPEAEVAEPASEAPVREQFAAELEIPEEDAGPEDTEDDEFTARRDRPATSGPEDWDCRGNIDASQLRAVIKGQPSKQVQTCYERRLKDNNLLQGSMTVLLTIGSSGSVKAISVDGTLNDRQVYACVKRVAKTWKFPQPEDGCVRTSVPFQMMPKL
ncbi:MAG: energy transducer TonB [Myxococcales bacterium]|nr:MAG: energy transducer TonB [Myxococcales bacterium]